MTHKAFESDSMKALRELAIEANQLEAALDRSNARVKKLEVALDMANQIIECYEDGVAHG